jgi:hypothetical protein
MRCGKTVAVFCENHTEHTDTLWAVRTTEEIRHVAATEANRLMLCGKTVAVCCENGTGHRYTVGSPYLIGDTSRLRYRAQPVNAVWENSRCFL